MSEKEYDVFLDTIIERIKNTDRVFLLAVRRHCTKIADAGTNASTVGAALQLGDVLDSYIILKEMLGNDKQ